jgi:hypothetical protein
VSYYSMMFYLFFSPTLRLSDLTETDTEYSEESQSSSNVVIMRRKDHHNVSDSKTAATTRETNMSPNAGNQTKRLSKESQSLEEREAAYRKARAEIFNGEEEPQHDGEESSDDAEERNLNHTYRRDTYHGGRGGSVMSGRVHHRERSYPGFGNWTAPMVGTMPFFMPPYIPFINPETGLPIIPPMMQFPFSSASVHGIPLTTEANAISTGDPSTADGVMYSTGNPAFASSITSDAGLMNFYPGFSDSASASHHSLPSQISPQTAISEQGQDNAGCDTGEDSEPVTAIASHAAMMAPNASLAPMAPMYPFPYGAPFPGPPGSMDPHAFPQPPFPGFPLGFVPSPVHFAAPNMVDGYAKSPMFGEEAKMTDVNATGNNTSHPSWYPRPGQPSAPAYSEKNRGESSGLEQRMQRMAVRGGHHRNGFQKPGLMYNYNLESYQGVRVAPDEGTFDNFGSFYFLLFILMLE